MKSNPRGIAIAFCLILLLPACARAYYSPEQGRWISRDPIGENGGVNLSAFVHNNPVARTDLLGKLALTKFDGTLTPGPCGQFSSWNTWSLDNNTGTADPAYGGIIVQYVAVSFNVTLCDQASSPFHFGPPSLTRVFPTDWPFYEAWSIPPGKAHPFRPGPKAYDDVWQMDNFGINTKGSITITAVASYFDGVTMPFYFWPQNAGPSNNNLPTSDWFAAPGPPTSTLHRTLTASWNCCCHIENTKVTRN